MEKYLPKMYQKDIFHIPYQKLKEKGIKVLIFDLDNTLATIDEKEPKQEVIDFIASLKKDFLIFIASNSFPHRVLPFGKSLSIKVYSLSFKPFSRVMKKIKKENKVEENEIAVIGDQFMTDMAFGNKNGAFTIFVDTLSKKEFKITSINRRREKKVFDSYQEKNLFKKGDYYESR